MISLSIRGITVMSIVIMGVVGDLSDGSIDEALFLTSRARFVEVRRYIPWPQSEPQNLPSVLGLRKLSMLAAEGGCATTE
jgi:hypothetical protein